ncbi:MAG: Na+ dependent nucleoside transporter N-terminal domain-containing protein, partial [Desulfobacterales bacterium]
MGAFQSLAGLVVFLFLAWLMSENRGRFPLRTAVIGIGAQLGLAFILLKFTFFTKIFFYLNEAVLALKESTLAGTSFVFGYIGGGEKPFEVTDPQATFIMAFQSLPLVLV